MKKRKVINGTIAVTCLVALTLTACSKSKTLDTKNGIYNPAYMGAETDVRGQKVEVGKGSNEQVANQELVDYQAQYNEAKVHKVTDNVYVANGYGISNSIMIEGDKGLTIVNTNDCVEVAQKEYEAFKAISDKPVTNIIYTNYQHSYGAKAYVTDTNKDQVQIIAHEQHSTEIEQLISEETPIMTARREIEQGKVIGNKGADGAVGTGLGAYETVEKKTLGYVAPTKFVSGTEVTEMDIDGVKMQFIPMESDSKDNLTLWLPDSKVCINDLILPTFPDIYNLSGGAYRNPKIWLQGITGIIDLEPDYQVGIYGLPLTKDENIKEELVLYRDALQLVYNQTIRFMNKKYSLDQVIQSVKLTDKLKTGKLAGDFFGETEYHVRAIFNGMIGWFGNDTIELHPVTDEFEAKKIVEGYGGTAEVMAAGTKALEEKQYSWVAQLAEYVLKVEPENKDAAKLKADALRNMAQVTTAADTRNYYLTEVAKLEGTEKQATTNGITKDKLMISSRDAFLKILRVSIDPEKCGDAEYHVKFNFTDENVQYGFQVRKGVGRITDAAEATDTEVSMTYSTFCDIAAGDKKLDECIQSGEVTVSGDADKFQQFRNIFDIKL